MSLTERQLRILSVIAQASDHTERHTGWVAAELEVPTTQGAHYDFHAEVHVLDGLGLTGLDLCGCDEATAYGITDAGYEALKAAGYCGACWTLTCACRQCGAPCSVLCGDDAANLQACGGGFGGSDG
jgi:hypothetical protein